MISPKFLAIVCGVLLLPSVSYAAGLATAVQGAGEAIKVGWFRSADEKLEAEGGAPAKPETAVLPIKPEASAKSAVIAIQPHRAIYTMALATAKNGSNITGVTGRMLFEWADDCDGWAVQQHLQLHFIYGEGDESDISSTVISWESKDGKRYNFNVRRMTNGKQTENFRGRATMGEQGGVAKYAIPKEKKEMPLADGTLFPSAHTKLILEKAVASERLFTRRVFDGSDDDGQADVSAFIGERRDTLQATEANPSLRDNPLLAQPAWPVRLAFFKPDTETGESDYEMNLVLQANGVARSMLIDYGEFSVSGVLSSLEALPFSSSCKD